MKLSEISNNIKPRTRILVRGQVNFSRIANKIAGDELDRANKYTKFPSKDPYFKMTIEITEPNPQDALIFDKNDQSETYLAAYVASKFYASKKDDLKGKTFFACQSKGQEIRVYQRDAEGKLHKVELNGNELGTGQNIEMELNYFETAYGAGVGLNAVVILDDKIQIYEGNYGVKGYEVADDTVSLPARRSSAPDVAESASKDETPVGDAAASAGGVETDPDPVGTTSAPGNSAFDDLLAKFKSQG